MKNVIPQIDRNSSESKSMDIVADNISKLKELFPEAFTEDKVDFDALKEVLGDYIEGREERYSFTWNGKSKARMLAQTPSTGTLRPCKEESVDWDTTQNLFIEGDNLEVLKLLQKSYHKKVKMIYIDPPYNTGKDFVYKDNFKDNIKNYKEITGQVDGDGRNLSNNPETSGRYHTDWLNMMYPRLKLARNLLKDDGVIFISIDDNEVANLRSVCDEIYGEENFVSQLTVIVKPEGRRYGHFAKTHEYILVYCRNYDLLTLNEILVEGAKHTHSDSEGGFSLKGLRNRNVQAFNSKNRPNLRYPFYCDPGSADKNGFMSVSTVEKDGFIRVDASTVDGLESVWRWGKEKAEKENKELVAYRGNDGDIRIFQKERKLTQMAKSVLFGKEFISNKGTKEVQSLIGKGLFDFPKPIALLNLLLVIGTDEDALVLDFFAGSSTTFHALMELNMEDSGRRKCISVQLPEKIENNKAGFETIADISKERIRRVATKIKEENPDYQGDLGFKVFKLDSTNIKPWELGFDLTEQDLEDQISNIKHGRTDLDVLYEILIKSRLELTLPITERSVAGHKVFDIGMGALMICLSDDITLDVVEGIAKLKDELNPEIMRVVFKDAGFADDVVKTNAVQILKQAGIEDVRSL
ncbi:site-specific DNA-methyltransferase [Thalassolituus sp. UBA2590]|uniref:site-specific DNA-methyltransferase n=1 Tax=Thalassolituus sp. UBA2590 TaxID=1947663 RepID=UPI0026497A06|nr:site-specific DNA-methyltransferase [Thalassolituus sp. UBA2590]